jgi:prevent-host-death family protein
MTSEALSVADAKRRFSELLDRVAAGERIVVTRRGKPAVALVPPGDEPAQRRPPPLGLLAIAGALADVEDFEETMHEVVASRRNARDRPAPDLG